MNEKEYIIKKESDVSKLTDGELDMELLQVSKLIRQEATPELIIDLNIVTNEIVQRRKLLKP